MPRAGSWAGAYRAKNMEPNGRCYSDMEMVRTLMGVTQRRARAWEVETRRDFLMAKDRFLKEIKDKGEKETVLCQIPSIRAKVRYDCRVLQAEN